MDSDGDAQVLMGRMISTLQDLYSFVYRCYDVARNTVQQLSALHCGAKLVQMLQYTCIYLSASCCY